MILDYEPGDKVQNPSNKEWGIGQVQSIINNKVTVNFENVGKKVINSDNIKLENCIPQSDFRGAWVTNVASDALVSPENIKLTVRNAVKYGINNLFVVVWNKGVTQYPSEVLEKYIGIKQDLKIGRAHV